MKHITFGLVQSFYRILQMSIYAIILIMILLVSDKYINPQPVINIDEIRIFTDGSVIYERTIFVTNIPVIWTGRIDKIEEESPVCEYTGILIYTQEGKSRASTKINALMRSGCDNTLPEGAIFSFTYIPVDNNFATTVYKGVVESPKSKLN